MNIVTMCRGGNVRSVAAKMVLQRYFGHEVIAIGADNTNDKTKNFLATWADYFVVMSAEFIGDVPTTFVGLVFLLEVGNDVWGDPFKEDLQLKIFDLAFKEHLLRLTAYTPNPEQVKQEIPLRIQAYKAKIAARNANDISV